MAQILLAIVILLLGVIVLRRIGLLEMVQRECRLTIAGPTTLWSLLNSLQKKEEDS